MAHEVGYEEVDRICSDGARVRRPELFSIELELERPFEFSSPDEEVTLGLQSLNALLPTSVSRDNHYLGIIRHSPKDGLWWYELASLSHTRPGNWKCMQRLFESKRVMSFEEVVDTARCIYGELSDDY